MRVANDTQYGLSSAVSTPDRERGVRFALGVHAGMTHVNDSSMFDATFKANVYAMFWLCKAALPDMPPGAAIINTASIQSYSPSPHLLDYASTKAAIVAFTKALAKQVASKGIRVDAVAPGPIWTPLETSGGQPPHRIPEFGGHVPLGRPGQPAEVAPVYVFLASQESSYATGETYGVTGGNPLP